MENTNAFDRELKSWASLSKKCESYLGLLKDTSLCKANFYNTCSCLLKWKIKERVDKLILNTSVKTFEILKIVCLKKALLNALKFSKINELKK